MITIKDVAVVCHEANRAYCQAFGDLTQSSWDEAQQWQRDSALNGVRFRIAHQDAPASAQHEVWLAQKKSESWIYGPVKDPSKKEHPCIVPFDQLPKNQQAKDALFIAIVDALKPLLMLS